MRSRLLLLAALGSATLLTAGTPALSVSDLVSFQGVGPVHVGMSRDELRKALADEMVVDEDSTVQDEPAPEDSCIFAALPSHRWGISWMLIGGRVARTDVTQPGFATVSGIRVGDPESRVISIYGRRVRVERHVYVDDGHYLTVERSDHKFAIVFETEGGTVTGFRVGRLPEALYIEGCQ